MTQTNDNGGHSARPAVIKLVSTTSSTNPASVATRRCRYLHPKHLTGCRRPAEPGSGYCARHGGAV
jgi:hypothetical protein